MSDDRFFREVNDYALVHGFAAGFPNFHQADHGDGIVRGTFLLGSAHVEGRDVLRTDLGVYHIEDVPAMFRAANDYAALIGYPAAFPNFHQADHGQGVVCGIVLIRPGVSEWRDVPRGQLGVYQIEDVGGMMRAASDYAIGAGFAAGFPTFHQADHGQGVVCGVVLLRPGEASWRDVPADFLALYSRPLARWAIILCNLSDLPPQANARDRYVQYFTEAGHGSGGAFDYWQDMSYGTAGLRGSEVFGFFDVGHTRAELPALGQRRQVFVWGSEAARANNVDLGAFDHRIVLLNGGGNDHGQTNGGVTLVYADPTPLEPTFIAHEMGHEFGLDHSFGEQPAPCAGGDARPGAYCDIFDIMSAMNVTSFQDAQNRRAGPSLNAYSRERLAWLHRSRIRSYAPTASNLGETITIAAIDRPEVAGFQMVKFRGPGRARPSETSTYTIELREATKWDRGFISPRVLLHEVGTDGLVRLVTSANGGVLTVGAEFGSPAPSTAVRVETIDSMAATATLRIWRLPADGRRQVRIALINYDPPGSDVAGEYVVLQNDRNSTVALAGWTLRDLASHVYTFPAIALPPGHTVTLWTRAGSNDVQNLYWGRGHAVWNNAGDIAILSDASGAEVSRYAYSG